jgi:hypothetical protein
MVNQLHIKKEITHQILYDDEQKRKIYTKLVPHSLTYKQGHSHNCVSFILVGACEYGNELSGSIKCGEFLD